MEIVFVMVLVAAAIALVATPLLPGRSARAGEAENAERAELEAARDAKYREIRDAELDHQTGKLSAEDWRAQDRALRREAVDVLERLDALDERSGEGRRIAARPAADDVGVPD
jgi:type II secretory pathway pseudopilin PulG